MGAYSGDGIRGERAVGLLSPVREQLLGILRSKALRALDQPVRLSAGGWSSHFIDAKKGLAAWRDLRIAGQAIFEAVENAGLRFDAAGGPTLGADALAVGIAAVSDTSWFVVRKEPKGHGTKQWIEGARIGPAVRVLLVDDVVTTGGSILKALDIVEETGAEVVAAVTLVDRSGLATVRLADRGVPYFPMATYENLGIEPVTLGSVAGTAG